MICVGCGFVKFANREMAAAAMNALDGTFVMRVFFALISPSFAKLNDDFFFSPLVGM